MHVSGNRARSSERATMSVRNGARGESCRTVGCGTRSSSSGRAGRRRVPRICSWRVVLWHCYVGACVCCLRWARGRLKDEACRRVGPGVAAAGDCLNDNSRQRLGVRALARARSSGWRRARGALRRHCDSDERDDKRDRNEHPHLHQG